MYFGVSPYVGRLDKVLVLQRNVLLQQSRFVGFLNESSLNHTTYGGVRLQVFRHIKSLLLVNE